jgi:hypothetical protein
MADKTGTFFGLNTVLIDIVLLVAFRTIIHFHPVPGVFLETGNVFTPYIAAVSGQDIIFIDRQTGGFSDITMTGPAIHFSAYYMSRV